MYSKPKPNTILNPINYSTESFKYCNVRQITFMVIIYCKS